ncbi:MAG: hypothetical protein AABX31_03410 [Nanoarchaeota archaeon]
MANYNKDKNLTQILVEGTRAVYGKEKAEELKIELGKLQLPSYGKNAEELTAIVDRVCGQPETVEGEAQSIDAVIHYQKLSKFYYPIVGMLSAKYQERVAAKHGDDPAKYMYASVIAEFVVGCITAFGGPIIFSSPVISISAFAIGGVLIVESALRANFCAFQKKPMGSFLLALPAYAALYSIAAVNARKLLYEQELQKNIARSDDSVKNSVLPTPETWENKSKVDAIKEETIPIGIEDTKIVDDELDDFDQRLEESKRSKE